jgi:hypothetical protein
MRNFQGGCFMRITMRWLAGMTLSLPLFATLPIAVAHHSVPAIFDSQSTMTLKGTVTDVLWVNPHVYLHIAAQRGGKSEDWVVELGSMNNLDRAGWTRERVKAGDALTITGWRGRPARSPYLGATVDPSGMPRLLRLVAAEFANGSKYAIPAAPAVK